MSGIFAAIKFLPELISIIKTILGMIESGKNYLEVKKYLGDLNEAIKKANESKDTSEIENMFNGSSDQS